AYGIDWMEIDDAEADDVIATLVREAPGRSRLIMSADRDFHQLLADDVQVLNTAMHPGNVTSARPRSSHGTPSPPPSGRVSEPCAETRRTTSPASGESDRPPPPACSPTASPWKT